MNYKSWFVTLPAPCTESVSLFIVSMLQFISLSDDARHYMCVYFLQ